MKKINIAYLIFFYGVGPNSTRILKDALLKLGLEDRLIEILVSTIDNNKLKEKVKEGRRFNYIPFEGHQSRLGHYYRHLFQAINYVDNQTIKINKYNYIKIIRAQLSNHEQALLFFNALSDMGKEWVENGLITKYRLIKNLPKNFIDEVNEINVKDVFPNLIFEWEENSNFH